jgi:hypothetical protein
VTREASAAIARGLEIQARDDRWTFAGSGLRLTFYRVGDRWSHSLAVGAGSHAVACPREWDADPDDPARVVSPVYQEVHDNSSEGTCLFLLTGQATPHHFAAVTTVRRDGETLTIEFDVADRCRRPVEALAATYVVQLGSSDLLDAGAERIVWEGGAIGGGRLEFATDRPGALTLAESGRRATQVQATAHVVAANQTHRLIYRWRWTPSPHEQRITAAEPSELHA